MTNEERVDIRITRTGKRKTSNILDNILETKEERTFPSNECMFEEDSQRSFEYSLKKNPIIEPLREEEYDRRDARNFDSGLTYSKTLRPMLRDMTGAVEQRGQLRIRRYDRADEVVWVVQIDRNRAKFLDRTFSDFIAFLKQAFNAE
jgi:hypothetical protein